MIDFSIIIPHKDSPCLLKRLLDSIPQRENIEIIIVDNSEKPLQAHDIDCEHKYKLLWANPSRYAGGARNEGLSVAIGKWVIFADADDYFTTQAFNSFELFKHSNADIVYFNCEAVYPETGERSNRADDYRNIIAGYNSGNINKEYIRYNWPVPWSKMIKKTLIQDHNILFDEVIAANDAYFSLMAGFYANDIDVCNDSVYVVTVVKGSLSKRRDYSVIKSRFLVSLRSNEFLRNNDLKKYQHSVMYLYLYSLKLGIGVFYEFSRLLLKYRQNLFIGITRWIHSIFSVLKTYKKDSKYITK